MKRFLLVASIVLFLFFLSRQAWGQSNQTVVSGSQTNAVNFPAGGCSYNWVNNMPGIGLPASGIGDISAFTAVNNGTTPIIATITATPTSTVFAYIPNQFSNNVSVVNTTTNTVVATIPVGAHPTGVSVSPDGSRVYITNNTDNTVSVINTLTNTVLSTIPVGTGPYGICVSPDGSSVYVANYNSATVSVINTTSNTVIATVPVGSYPWGIAVSPDGTRVYCASSNDDTVSEINTATNTVIAIIPVGPHPYGVVVGADGTRLYVSSAYSNTVTVINTTNNTTVTTIKASYVSDTPAMSLSPDGSTLYLVDTYIAIINTATNAILSYIPANTPYGISISPDGKFLYGTDENTSTMWSFNLATNTGVASTKIGINPISFGNFVKGPVCPPITFTVTVKPTQVVSPTINTGTATGTISACQGSPSASPGIEQFTVSGVGLTNNITATAPAGFEVSLSAGTGYGTSVTVNQTGGVANNTTVYVRSAASATGIISGNVTLTSQGANAQNVAVTGKINPLPIVNAVGNQTVSAGNNTTAINFTGTANAFNWTNNNPAIGLSASGSGSLPAFTAVNNGTSPLTAVVTVTPTNKQVYAYVPNTSAADVSVIDVAANRTIGTIPVGKSPIGVFVSPDGTKVYITNQQSSSISVISTATNIVQTTITLAAGTDPTGIVVSPDGSKIYVTNHQTNTVSIINAVTNTLISTLAVGTTPLGICISPDGSKVYVTNSADNTVSVINTATNIVITTIPVGVAPDLLCVSADGSTLYVANYGTNNVSVINTLNNTLITTISTGSGASGVAMSPNGNLLYVSNTNDNTVSVINTANNSVIATIPVNSLPYGMSISKDGSKLYVANIGSKSVTIINTLNNAVTGVVNVGLAPEAIGDFISETTGCDGATATFTITVNPLSVSPTITTGAVTGTISACQGYPSASPDVEQFTVSGNNLTNDIIATAPSGFEVSLSPTNGYGTSLTLNQSNGKVSNVTVYVRSAVSASGNISGSITLTSQGASSQSVRVTGNINPLPTVNPVGNQVVISSRATVAVNFTGTASTYNWVIDNPSIGTGNGSGGNIGPFITSNTGNAPVIGTFIVTPINTTTGCSGTPITFTIEVDPLLPANITATGTLSSLSTVYGTASASTSFSVSGTSMNEGILVTPPAGFEVSTDNTHFSQTVTAGASGTIAATVVYIRLTSKTPVGSYSGNITLSSLGATDVNLAVPNSVVNPAPLTIAANNVQKPSGQTLTNGMVSTGFTSSGLQNNETIGSVFMTYHEGADAAAKIGTYTGSVVPSDASGGSFDPKNYTITYKAGDIIVTEGVVNTPVAIPNAFTPNGDGINDVWNIKSLIDYPSCLVSIFTRYGSLIYQSRGYAKPWDGVYNGSPLPTGTYYYIINLQNGQPPLSGWVALIR